MWREGNRNLGENMANRCLPSTKHKIASQRLTTRRRHLDLTQLDLLDSKNLHVLRLTSRWTMTLQAT